MNADESPLAPSPVLMSSLPKSGTNLVARLLSLLGLEDRPLPMKPRNLPWVGQRRPAKFGASIPVGVDLPATVTPRHVASKFASLGPGSFGGIHALPSPKLIELWASRGPLIVVFRDPRSVIVSHTNYILAAERHPLHKDYRRMPSDADRQMTSLLGSPKLGLTSLAERYAMMLGWQSEGALTLLFEDVVGAQGGGTVERQLQAVQQVRAHIGLPPCESGDQVVAADLFGSSKTYRSGRIDSWTDELDSDVLALVADVCALPMQQLGYS